jgi:hypothetical protein
MRYYAHDEVKMPKIPLNENQGFLIRPAYDAKAFSRAAIACFPELKDDLEYFADLLHVQMGMLAESISGALKSGDSNQAIRILEFLEKALSQPDPTSEIRNAIATSFISCEEFRANPLIWRQCQSIAPLVKQILLDSEA